MAAFNAESSSIKHCRSLGAVHLLCRDGADNDTLERGGWMATQGESAVLVLAAGAGTRMRSDTPKVLHPVAGRSMLAHSLHAIAKMAPQHLVVVLGQDHGSIEQVVGELAGTLGRSIDTAIQD